MATYTRFEDLPVWQSAAELYEGCDEFLEQAPPRLRPSFRNHLERAVLLVSSNIAEGFERGTTKELLAFNSMARGSAGEVRSMLKLLLRRGWVAQYKAEISKLIQLTESCSRQLKAWSEALQKIDSAGARPQNHPMRKETEARQPAGSSNFRTQIPDKRPEGGLGTSASKSQSSTGQKLPGNADAKSRPTQTPEGKFGKRMVPLSNARSGIRD